MHDEMHPKFLIIEVIDQNERRASDRVDVQAKFVVKGFLRIASKVLFDGVIDACKSPLRNSGTEGLGALLDEGLELRDVRSGSNDAPHGCLDLRSAMKAAISA